jgi:hypothetical protein
MAGFGFGNFIKPQATSVRPGDMPGFKDLSMQEKLMMLGATMRGDMAGAQQIPMLAAARARQAQQMGSDRELERFVLGEGIPTLNRTERQAIREPSSPPVDATSSAAAALASSLGGLEGVPIKRDRVNVNVPQFDVEPGQRRQGPPTLRDALPLLMKRRALGIDIKPDIEMLDKAGPDVKYERGIRYDARDPSSAPREIIDVDKGQQRVFDANGNVVGVMNAKGYVQSVADLERAKAEATEGVKAGLDVGVYEDAAGIPHRMTRAQAAGALNGGIPAVGGGTIPAPPLPGGRARGGYPDISRGQSAAEKALAEGRAKNTVDAEGMVVKDATQGRIDLPKLRDQAKFTLGIMDKIRRHPSLEDRTGNSTLLPALRAVDVDFDTLVDQVSGGAFLEAIQSLKGSGQITEIEGKKATDAIARMKNQRQSKQGFLDAMNDYESVVRAGLARAEAKAARAAPGAGGASRYTPEDRARAAEILRQRRAARGGA